MELAPLVTPSTPVKADRNATIDNDDDDSSSSSSSIHQDQSSGSSSGHNIAYRRTRMGGACWWIFLLLFGVVIGVVVSIHLKRRNANDESMPPTNNNHPAIPNVAFCGNSMTYYNDLPRLVEIMLRWSPTLNVTTKRTTQQTAPFPSNFQDTCLTGGSNLASLWTGGCHTNERYSKFGDQGTVQSLLQQHYHWKSIVLQDNVQYAVNFMPQNTSIHDFEPRNTSLQALRNWYLPEILVRQPTARVLLLQTFPPQTGRFRAHLFREADFDAFGNALVEGYDAYAALLRSEFPSLSCTVVPVAVAAQRLYHDPDSDLFEKLHHTDDYHPSPHGTWLIACLVVVVLTGQPPPPHDPTLVEAWQSQARFWATTENAEMTPPPDNRDAEDLRQLACQVVLDQPCG